MEESPGMFVLSSWSAYKTKKQTSMMERATMFSLWEIVVSSIKNWLVGNLQVRVRNSSGTHSLYDNSGLAVGQGSFTIKVLEELS